MDALLKTCQGTSEEAILEALLKADPATLRTFQVDAQGNLLIHHFTKLGMLSIVEALIDKFHVNVNAQRTSDGGTALHIAVYYQKKKRHGEIMSAIIALLMSRGADPAIKNNYGEAYNMMRDASTPSPAPPPASAPSNKIKEQSPKEYKCRQKFETCIDKLWGFFLSLFAPLLVHVLSVNTQAYVDRFFSLFPENSFEQILPSELVQWIRVVYGSYNKDVLSVLTFLFFQRTFTPWITKMKNKDLWNKNPYKDHVLFLLLSDNHCPQLQWSNPRVMVIIKASTHTHIYSHILRDSAVLL